ncbi:unnamed protein product [Phaeothamnion confervicola]
MIRTLLLRSALPTAVSRFTRALPPLAARWASDGPRRPAEAAAIPRETPEPPVVRVDRVVLEKTKTDACGPVDEDEDEMEQMFVQGPAGMEWGGPTRGGRWKEPTRFGDWERKGRCSDF